MRCFRAHQSPGTRAKARGVRCNKPEPVDAATPSKASSTSLPMRPAKPTLSVRLDVFLTISLVRQKMENSTVMPEVETVRRSKPGDIGLEPFDIARARAKTFLGMCERSRRDVQHRQPRESRVEQKIHEHRCTAAHLDDTFLFAHSACLDELERGRRARLIPTHIIVLLGLIDMVPMLFDAPVSLAESRLPGDHNDQNSNG